MRDVGRIEYPSAALVQQELLHRTAVDVGRNLELLACTDKVGSSIRTEEFHWAPDGEESPEGINEA